MVRTPPLENHKAKAFLSNTSPDTLENHKATKPAKRHLIDNHPDFEFVYPIYMDGMA